MEGVGLLVPVLAATAVVAVLGLLAALSRKRSTEDASRAYLAGVRYVLSDEPDAAIAELSRAAQLNTGTTETYFALAALMRRKGELAWAIRLGQNMLLKPQLQPEVRRRARLELALDYRRAGMQDRARETFEALVADAPVQPEALVAFRRLLEESQDWARAVEIQELRRPARGERGRRPGAPARTAVARRPPVGPGRGADARRARHLAAAGRCSRAARPRPCPPRRGRPGGSAGRSPRGGDARARDRGPGLRAGDRGRSDARGMCAVARGAGGPTGRARAPGVADARGGADPRRPSRRTRPGCSRRRWRGRRGRWRLGVPSASCCSPPARSTRCGTSTGRCCGAWVTRSSPSAARAVARVSAPSTSAVPAAAPGTRCRVSAARPPGNLTPSGAGRNTLHVLMRDTHRMREKYDLSLDSRQVVSLLIGGIVVLGAVFVLGVLVGKKLAGTPRADHAPDLLTALDHKSDALERARAAPPLTFQEELTRPAAPTPTVARVAPATPPPRRRRRRRARARPRSPA